MHVCLWVHTSPHVNTPFLLSVCSSAGGGSQHRREDAETGRCLCCEFTNDDGRGCRPLGAKRPQVSHRYGGQDLHLEAVEVCKMLTQYFQIPAEVWKGQLLSGLQCNAGFLPLHGHEGQPSVSRPSLQETTGGVHGTHAPLQFSWEDEENV